MNHGAADPSLPTSYPLMPTGLAALLMGTRPRQRLAMRDFLLAVILHVVVAGMLVLGWRTGLLTPWKVWLQIGYSAAGVTAMYAWLRSNRGWPSAAVHLPYVHLLFGLSAIVLNYALFETARAVALQMLCLALVYDMRKFSPQQTAVGAALAIALMALSLLVRCLFVPGGKALDGELLGLAGSMLLLPAVVLVVRRVNGIQSQLHGQERELAGALLRLQQLATRDALTGLLNRREMTALLRSEQGCMKTGGGTSLAILDIDFFKRINDTHGHAIGDKVLRDFSAIARDHLEPLGTLARWGGEEFVFMMKTADAARAHAAIERLRHTAKAHDWSEHVAGLQVAFSAGLTTWRHGEQAEAALERADRALYEAKTSGRSRTVVA